VGQNDSQREGLVLKMNHLSPEQRDAIANARARISSPTESAPVAGTVANTALLGGGSDPWADWRAGVREEHARQAMEDRPQEQGEDLSLGSVALGAITNIPSSAAQFASDVVTPILHPWDTAKSVVSLGLGLIQLLIPGEQEDEKTARAVGKFFSDRYGGIDNVKRTLKNDPVGFLSDISVLFTAGTMAALKAPASVQRVLAKIASTTDPVRLAIKTVGEIGKKSNLVGRAGAVGASVLGMTSGIGGDVFKEAYKAGQVGGRLDELFTSNLRGNAPIEAVLTSLKTALDTIRSKRGIEYRKNIGRVYGDKSVLDFTKIDDGLRQVAEIGVYKGKVLNRSASDTWDKIAQLVDEWRVADPKVFHTPEGLDALKKAIGDVRDSSDFGSPSRVISDKVYNSVKAVIEKQAPEYAKVMREYQQVSELITDIEKTLSMKPNASIDTQLRKLQSVMRNNVNTSYGRRKSLIDILDETSGEIMPQIAGQAASSWTPRGLQGAVGSANVLAQGVGVFSGATNPLAALAMLAPQSPRLIAEAARLAGRSGRVSAPLIRTAGQLGPRLAAPMFQVGRLPGLLEDQH